MDLNEQVIIDGYHFIYNKITKKNIILKHGKVYKNNFLMPKNFIFTLLSCESDNPTEVFKEILIT